MAARLSMSSRHILLPLLLALCSPLAGCEGQSDSQRIAVLLYEKITNLGGSSDATRSQVSAIPYATLGVQLGSSDQAILVLEGKSGETLHFVGGTFGIAVRDGRIVRTVGFNHNLTGLQVAQTGNGQAAPNEFEYRYDLADRNAYGVAVRCTQSDSGPERIEILGVPHLTEHLIENCTAPDVDWTFRNELWRDQSENVVWKSIQFVHPDLDPLTVEILRPAA